LHRNGAGQTCILSTIVIHPENQHAQSKTALVTGSTSGIGLGIAKALAAQGAHVILNGFGDEEGPAEVAALNAPGARSPSWRRHEQASEIEAMMQFASSEFGQVDILVNNAGIPARGPASNFRLKMGRDSGHQI
jgi:3-hydroxybutyrate dehydrogenase